jgi:predicted RNase H-like HicB family nuclease
MQDDCGGLSPAFRGIRTLHPPRSGLGVSLSSALDSALIEDPPMNFTLECEQEEDGRWLAEVLELPGALAYGGTKEGAMARVEALALRVLAERLEHGEARPMAISISLPVAA